MIRYLIIICMAQLSLGTAVLFSQGTVDVWMDTYSFIDAEFGQSIILISSDKVLLNSGYWYNNFYEGTKFSIYSKNGCLLEVNGTVAEGDLDFFYIYDLIPVSSGGYVGTGVVYINEDLYLDALLMKFNANLELEWWNHFGGYNLENGWGVIEVSDGYVIAGNTWSYSSNTSSDGYLVKTDLEGNFISEDIYDTGGETHNIFFDVVRLENDEILVSGGSNADPVAGINDNMIVKRYDHNLNELDSQYFLIPEPDVGTPIITRLHDANILISGPINYYGNNGTDTWIAKITPDLDTIIWQYLLNVNAEMDLSAFSAELNNGDILIGGSTDANNDPFVYEKVAWLAKFSPDGVHKWTKEYVYNDSTYWDEFTDIVVTENDEIYISGNVYTTETFVGSDGQGYYNTDPWILKMDTAGNIYKPLFLQHSFVDDTIPINLPYTLPPYEAQNGSPCYDYIWVVQDPDGFALSGPGEDNLFTPTKSGRYRFTLIVQDEGGEQVSTQFELWVEEGVGVDDPPNAGIGLRYNPFSDHCMLLIYDAAIRHLSIYDVNGRRLLTKQIEGSGEVSIPATGWPAGIYHISAYDADHQIRQVLRAVKE